MLSWHDGTNINNQTDTHTQNELNNELNKSRFMYII
jgi:hypothetical protein